MSGKKHPPVITAPPCGVIEEDFAPVEEQAVPPRDVLADAPEGGPPPDDADGAPESAPENSSEGGAEVAPDAAEEEPEAGEDAPLQAEEN